MPLTNAQKQSAHRAKILAKAGFLEATNAVLIAENADLKAKLDKATAKINALQKKLKTMVPAPKSP